MSAIKMERCPPSAWNGVRHHGGMLSAITAERRPGSRGIRSALNHDQVVALCKTLTVSAFLPRYDATTASRILDRPSGSRALFAAAYETDIVAVSEAARRSTFLTH